MTRYGILALAALAFGFSAAAQSSSPGTADASAQVTASTTASAATARENQNSTSSASAATSSRAAASANAGGDSLSLASGTAMRATLVTPLDAKHSKQGDPLVAKTTEDVKQNGRVVLRKGSELKGHVTQVEARSSKNTQSAVGVVFDSAVPRGEHEPVPVNLSIQALAAAQSQSAASVGEDQSDLGPAGQAGLGTSASAGGGLVRGVGSAVGGAAGTMGSAVGNAGQTAGGTLGAADRTVASAGSTGGLNAAGQLTSNSTGVFNLQGLDLNSAVSNGTQASVVNSAKRNVHLASGTQMMLEVVGR
jgi:hypothetical protein